MKSTAQEQRNASLKLASYGLLAGAVMGAPAASNAAVVYTDPADVTVATTSAQAVHSLDLNGDSITDLDMVINPAAVDANPAPGAFLGAAEVLFAMPFQAGDYIGPEGGSAMLAQQLNLLKSGGSSGGWPNDVNDPRYLGLQFLIGSGLHSGWVRIGTAADALSGTAVIYDYAYEDVAGEGILAGDTGAAAIPEPSTLTMFAAGAAGLAAVRSRRKKRT